MERYTVGHWSKTKCGGQCFPNSSIVLTLILIKIQAQCLKYFLQCHVHFCHTITRISHNYTYISSLLSQLPFPSSHPSRPSECQTGLPVLYSNFLPTIHFTHGSVCIPMLLSPFIPLPPSPSVSTTHPLHLCLHFFPAKRFIKTIFLDSICLCQYIYFSLSDLLHSYVTGSRFIHITRTDSNSFFLWLSNIPWYIYTTSSL